MINLCTKFEVSTYTREKKDMKGGENVENRVVRSR